MLEKKKTFKLAQYITKRCSINMATMVYGKIYVKGTFNCMLRLHNAYHMCALKIYNMRRVKYSLFYKYGSYFHKQQMRNVVWFIVINVDKKKMCTYHCTAKAKY